ncbi:50S ribosomal protein L18 [Borreliella yangtzensis]|uniref:Large ribosomal subunit protein uL18 n=1 Tax=Borreliella yangtzensis TaxID=683292 RepID=A0ABR6P886_9SPIR|nr:50S ribosomal protein L18 [Borreliella yangtzensis]MBB6042485.1 large subunit ribosomal protein L18 [Borreliella yangtzensis]WKC73456.1 50S ribosomal protein L18 [Borreliella yangtzensis]WKC74371.1 50S ribosomal protein L18 [Borreliella yangtzensis]
MKKIKESEQRKLRRKKRIKSKIGRGVVNRPRITIFKSNRYFYAQVIDDSKGHTVASISTIEKGLNLSKNINDVKKLGEVLAKRLKEKNINNLIFDRNGYKYHGLIASFATSLREFGINI